MSSAQASFDPDRYKATTREQWETAAEAWYRWGPLRVESAAECLRFEKASFGALHQMLSGLDQGEKDDAWEEIEQALGDYERDGGFEGPCEMLVAAGRR